jgi:hypothetical protein
MLALANKTSRHGNYLERKLSYKCATKLWGGGEIFMKDKQDRGANRQA